MAFPLPEMTLFESLGLLGFALCVPSYSLLTLRRLSGDCIADFLINFSAASLVMVGLMASFNLAAAMIQGFFITMSIVGIVLRLHRNRTATAITVTAANSPCAPFQSVRRSADGFPETGSPGPAAG